MKKIAYIARNLNVNGISSVILNYSTNLDSNKFIIDIYVGNPIAEENLEKIKNYKNIKIISTPSKRGKNPFKYYAFLKKNIKNYDVVHVHGNSRTIGIELLFVKKQNKCIIAHSHSTSSDFKLIHYLFKPFFSALYDYGIACSKEAGNWMFGNRNYIIIPNGIDMDKYRFDDEKRRRIRESLKIDDNCKVIGHVGNFSAVKNYPFIIELFDKICEKNSDYKLLLIGKYQNNSEIEKFIRNSKNSDKIILFGTTGKIYEYYNAMDCFILPSKYEGLGIVAIEAQVNGLKCFVSNKVPFEVNFTNNIEFLSLDDSVDLWSKKILEIDCSKHFVQFEEKVLIDSQYNNNSCLEKLKKIYDFK